jgi:hypothetical protein
MSQYKISKKRLAEIIKEEYDAAMERTDEAHCGGDHAGNRDEGDKSTEEYDDAPELEGAQKDLPDGLQKAIINKNKKKIKKESLDSIRTLIQQELKNL